MNVCACAIEGEIAEFCEREGRGGDGRGRDGMGEEWWGIAALHSRNFAAEKKKKQ